MGTGVALEVRWPNQLCLDHAPRMTNLPVRSKENDH